MDEIQGELYGGFDVLHEGFSINHLIYLMKLSTKKPVGERDSWWVVRFQNLLNTYEESTGQVHPFLRHELNKTKRLVDGV